MDLFKRKEESKSTEEELKILATSIEVINQRLAQIPGMDLTESRMMAEKQSAEIFKKLDYMDQMLKFNEKSVKDSIEDAKNSSAKQINTLNQSIKSFVDAYNQGLSMAIQYNEYMKKMITSIYQIMQDTRSEVSKLANFKDEVRKGISELSSAINRLVEVDEKLIRDSMDEIRRLNDTLEERGVISSKERG